MDCTFVSHNNPFIFHLNFIENLSFDRIELAVWTHSVASDIKPELLQDMPEHDVIGTNGTSNTHTTIDSITSNANIVEPSDESNLEQPTLAPEQIEAVKIAEGEKPLKPANGESALTLNPSTRSLYLFYLLSKGAPDSLDESTLSEDSLEPTTPIIANEETNDSDSHSSAKR